MTHKPLILSRSIAEGLDAIGDRWALLILDEAFRGTSRFEVFRQHTGASKATLTRRLASLLTSDILYKRPTSATSSRFEYRFTEKGLGLFGASLLARHWETLWTTDQDAPAPHSLFHTQCHQTLAPVAACRHCKQAIRLEDVTWLGLTETLEEQLDEIKRIHQHRRARAQTANRPKPQSLIKLADLVGDRWTLLILVVAFFGIDRYDDFLKQLKIAPSMLIERLKRLVAAEVLSRKRYQNNPPRYTYKLTDKGKSLYPFIMALRQWAIDWLPSAAPDATLIHEPCGKTLVVDVNCQGCEQSPWPKDVQLIP
jgi:DNA-binding HxlR family transcriptional regulator